MRSTDILRSVPKYVIALRNQTIQGFPVSAELTVIPIPVLPLRWLQP